MTIVPKCPTCGTQVSAAELVVVNTDLQRTKLYGPIPARGYGYVCPNASCGVLLPLWPQDLLPLWPQEERGKENAPEALETKNDPPT